MTLLVALLGGVLGSALAAVLLYFAFEAVYRFRSKRAASAAAARESAVPLVLLGSGGAGKTVLLTYQRRHHRPEKLTLVFRASWPSTIVATNEIVNLSEKRSVWVKQNPDINVGHNVDVTISGSTLSAPLIG